MDLSSIPLDGSHTLAKNGGAAIGYQGRKAARTTNLLFLADNTGQPLAVASPQAGNHHDVFDIETSFGELCTLVEEAHISLEGLFLSTRIVDSMPRAYGKTAFGAASKPTSR